MAPRCQHSRGVAVCSRAIEQRPLRRLMHDWAEARGVSLPSQTSWSTRKVSAGLHASGDPRKIWKNMLLHADQDTYPCLDQLENVFAWANLDELAVLENAFASWVPHAQKLTTKLITLPIHKVFHHVADACLAGTLCDHPWHLTVQIIGGWQHIWRGCWRLTHRNNRIISERVGASCSPSVEVFGITSVSFGSCYLVPCCCDARNIS